MVGVTYDAAKRFITLERRGLDFKDAVQVFAGTTLTIKYDRTNYGETRFQTLGMLGGRLIMLVWTPRNGGRHIISMRRANDRERKKYDACLE